MGDLPFFLMILLLGFGLVSGFLAGLLGVGGGLMLVPALVFVLGHQGVSGDLAIKMAVAASMATIVLTSLSSVWSHHRRGAIRWDLVRRIAPGIIAGGMLAGAGAFSILKGQTLGLVFAGFVGFSSYRLFRAKRPSTSQPVPQGVVELAAAGGAIGFISALVGAGGGFLSVPYMSRRGIPLHAAVATSAALGLPIALASVTGYIASGWSLPQALPGSWGYFYLPAIGLIAAGSITTAPWGAKVAHGLDVTRLRRIFSLMLALLAVYMLQKSLLQA